MPCTCLVFQQDYCQLCHSMFGSKAIVAGILSVWQEFEISLGNSKLFKSRLKFRKVLYNGIL